MHAIANLANLTKSCNRVDDFGEFGKLPNLFKLAQHIEASHIDNLANLAKFCQIIFPKVMQISSTHGRVQRMSIFNLIFCPKC